VSANYGSAPLDRRFEAVVFDWEGMAVPDRFSDADRLRRAVEEACALGMHFVVVSGTQVGNVDGQLGARPEGPGTLYLLVNGGAEVFRVRPRGPVLVERRGIQRRQLALLVAAAELTVRRLREAGVDDVSLVRRSDRVRIDLIAVEGWRDPPKARLAALVAAVEARLRRQGVDGLRAVVEIARESAVGCGVPGARVTTDAKHVELGVTDKSDSARWCFAALGRLGVGPGAVLVAGDEFGPLGGVPGSDSLLLVPEAARAIVVSVGAEPGGCPGRVIALGGGPPAFVALIEDQIERRRRGELPAVDADPAWTLAVVGAGRETERVNESRLALADGRIGTRGSVIADVAGGSPAVFAAGVYRGVGPESELLPAPRWNRVAWRPRGEPRVRRVLDMRAGVLRQQVEAGSRRVDALLFSSLARPGTAVLRASAADGGVGWGRPLVPPPGSAVSGTDRLMTARGAPDGVTVAASQAIGPTLDRVAAYRTSPRAAVAALRRAQAAGFETLLNEHRKRVGRRWEGAAIDIAGDPELERAIRFALFHLIGSVGDRGEAAVGARGLTGPAYRGHVFWDADVFVLPFLAATHPRAARAMLEYRVRRLAVACAEARREGSAGAHFPWESAATGVEAAPTRGRDRLGRFTAIRTGQLEEHIVADVAWAACCYADWTGDEAFLRGAGRGLVLETARWWGQRIELDAAGRAHIRGVIGPDEYHEPVDDNAFTNVMARWNLRRAAALADQCPQAEVGDGERSRWRALADALVDGYDPSTGIYEQFAGFHALEPLLIADVAPRRPIAATLLLGHRRIAGAQVVKQADVLMLHHLLPADVAAGSLEPNLAYYEPRTAHGSSLSPGVHASLLARAGRLDDACELLRVTCGIDLDDITQTTAGGVHLAAMGSAWQAVAFGFAGLRPCADTLLVSPRVPHAWGSLTVRVRFRGTRLRIVATADSVLIHADRRVRVRVDDGEPVVVGRGETSFSLTEGSST
jgi:trehalose/maltose hydrolase-like predicted phosphorylase